MGTESFLINHKTKEIFSVRGFWRFEENELREALGSKEKLIAILKTFHRSPDEWTEWVSSELLAFCKDTPIEQIGFCPSDEDYGDGNIDYIVAIHDAINKRGEYKLTKDIFDYKADKPIWKDFYANNQYPRKV